MSTMFRTDDFEIGRALGKGRFGNVYIAQHKSTENVVALKVMLKSSIEQAKCTRRLKSELEIHSRLIHPNILRMFGYFQDTAKLYLVLEYASRGTLESTLRERRLLSEEEARKVLRPLTSAVLYLHDRHVIHRDIKPENVLFRACGTPALSDFGWSVHAIAPYCRRSTFCGTLEYMAPEIVTAQQYTSAIDMWALGVLAFELLLGYTPFFDSNLSGDAQTTAIINSISVGHVDFGAECISRDAVDFISKLLDANTETRMDARSAIQHCWLVG